MKTGRFYNSPTSQRPNWPLRRGTCLGLALVATICGTSPPLRAQPVFDPTGDFSVTNGNPNGVWSYGWMPVDFSAFHLDTHANPAAGDGLWQEWAGDLGGDGSPDVAKRLGPESEGVPTGWIKLHPGPGTEPSVLRWQAPSSGAVAITGQFLPGNIGIMQVAVRQGTNFLWQAVDSGTFELFTAIEAGQMIDFTVFGGYACGSTPLEATISYYCQTNAPPTIYGQPASQSHLVGDTAQLNVFALGTWPLAYQWYKEATALNHQTNSVLILTNLVANDAGDYTVVITNAFGSVTSAAARLKVAHRPMQTFVSAQSTHPMWPYDSWATAATNIQHAVDASAPGGQVLVTNGVYPGAVTVTKPTRLRSVNGPEVTVIDGGGPCISLTDGASLAGFTLRNGVAYSGAGVSCASTNAFLTNCVIRDCYACFGVGGGACGGRLYNCTLTGNWARPYGGGAYGAILYSCTVTGNSAIFLNQWPYGVLAGSGAGVYDCTLYNCTLTENSANEGAGAYGGTLYNCAIIGNSAVNDWAWQYGYITGQGGGVYGSTLYNCTVTGNSSTENGGGTCEAIVYGSALTSNSAGWGGGADHSTLYNCTVSGNSATGLWWGDYWLGTGGGVTRSALYNSIVYYNGAANGANYDTNTTLNFCCTTPLPTNGIGNIALDPQLTSISHLSSDSPCRGGGSTDYAIGTDIDSEMWDSPPSIGCDEYHSGAVTGPLTVNLATDYTNVTTGYPVKFRALVEGRTTGSLWSFGDGHASTNQPYTTHAWAKPGDYLLALWVFNESHPEGVSASVTMHVVTPLVVYVDAASPNPQPPYTSWATAARNVQDAVDAAEAPAKGLGLVLVADGVYPGGVTVTSPLTLRSIKGDQFTTIDAGYANRCVYLADGATLSGFTLRNGIADPSGGGAYCESPRTVVSNCTFTANFASCGGGAGGIPYADAGTFYNCTFTANSAFSAGGAVGYSTLYNCTLTGNSAMDAGGGAFGGRLYNCIVYSNVAPNAPNYTENSSLNYCCTTPMPTNGFGNIEADPLFLDFSGGNLRLQSNSPCINAGRNTYATTINDLDGNPRVVSGTVDMGAYEYQGTGSRISYAWLQRYGLPTDGSADFIDSDADHHNNWQEWVCGTSPVNSLSALRMVSAVPGAGGVTVSWQSVAGINYFLECSTNLSASPCFRSVATNVVGYAGLTSYAHTNAIGSSPFFYRVGVQCP